MQYGNCCKRRIINKFILIDKYFINTQKNNKKKIFAYDAHNGTDTHIIYDVDIDFKKNA